jgi:ribosomal protein S18 acetylase RimI-like enzyme
VTSAVRVRAAEAGDLAAVAELRWRWSVEENGATPRVPHDEYAAAVAAWAETHQATHAGFVAERDGVVIGMTWIALTPRFPTPQSVARLTADLQSVYVVPEARGGGIGSELVRTALGHAAAAGAARAVVHSSDAAITLYRGAGFGSSERLMDVELPRPGD